MLIITLAICFKLYICRVVLISMLPNMQLLNFKKT